MTSVDDRVEEVATVPPRSARAASPARAVRGGEMGVRRLGAVPWGICAITAIAAVLRLVELDDVVGNPFYDASVRSMGLSWHNFLFGAFDPGAILSVDKPPLDLWLQVASVKVLGWGAFALKLPEAVGGTLAVPLLYDAVRRALGRGAGLASAAALAVMPISVLTSRSDTMDSLMMLCVVVALWLTVRATILGGRRSLVLAGVALGLAFNVKLLEGLVALPALALLYAAAARVSRRRRATDIALAGVALLIVSLSWAIVVTLAPGRHPFAIGSTNGSVFDAMFNFNAFGRLAGTLPAGGVYSAPPGVFRLMSGVGSIGQLFGVMLIAALALGAAAVVVEWQRRSSAVEPRRSRLAFAFVMAVFVWLGLGVAVLSYVSVLHARYLEMVTPAVAATIGCGLAAVVSAVLRADRRPTVSVVLLSGTLAGVTVFTSSLTSAWVVRAAVIAEGAILAAGLALFVPGATRRAAWLAGVLALISFLTFPIRESEVIVREARSDSVGLQVQPRKAQAAISRYLRPRTRGTRYELAADDALALAPLLIHDARPVLPLTSFASQPLLSLAQLQRAVRSDAVRYAVISRYPCKVPGRGAACVLTAIWIRQHGVDVSAEVGIPAAVRLLVYRLPR